MYNILRTEPKYTEMVIKLFVIIPRGYYTNNEIYFVKIITAKDEVAALFKNI